MYWANVEDLRILLTFILCRVVVGVLCSISFKLYKLLGACFDTVSKIDKP